MNFKKAIEYDPSYKEAINNLKLVQAERQSFMFSPGLKGTNNLKYDIIKWVIGLELIIEYKFFM